MELKDLCNLTNYHFLHTHQRLDPSDGLAPLSPAFRLAPPASFSPSHPSLVLDSPGSDTSSFSLFCGSPSLEPHSPTGSSSSGRSGSSFAAPDSRGGGGAGHFSTSSRGSTFSAQVDSVLKCDYLAALGAAPKRLCLVCGDYASGYHYGVASCEACKAFFKRTIQGNIEYSCPVVRQCEITKRRRKSCQACRFQKCLQAGMMKEGVRMDRVRGGRQKYKRGLETGVKSQHTHPISDSRNKVIAQLLVTEPAPLTANHDNSTNDSSLQTLLTLCDLLNRELLLLIGWAKHIPGFSELSLVDQMSLLQSGWMEALLVGVAWRSQDSGEELVFAENLRLNESQCRAIGLADLYSALRHLTCKYQAMRLIQEEALTLKALVLANSDADPLDCADSVQRFQDILHEALQDLESSQHPLEPHRAGRLLMGLPLLRQAAAQARHCLLRLHAQRTTPWHKLLLEMLQASM